MPTTASKLATLFHINNNIIITIIIAITIKIAAASAAITILQCIYSNSWYSKCRQRLLKWIKNTVCHFNTVTYYRWYNTTSFIPFSHILYCCFQFVESTDLSPIGQPADNGICTLKQLPKHIVTVRKRKWCWMWMWHTVTSGIQWRLSSGWSAEWRQCQFRIAGFCGLCAAIWGLKFWM